MSNTYTGWIRLPGRVWQAVVTASTEDEAWRLLHQHAEQLNAKQIDTYIGPASVEPRGRHRPSTPGVLFNGLMD